MSSDADSTGLDVAVVGMAIRAPGAGNIAKFWDNVRQGVATISRFTPAELAGAGVPAHVYERPDYVPAAGVLAGADVFDAAYFGYSPRDARLLDPQQRVFLECAGAALEDAGYGARQHRGPVGVYAGASASTYLLRYLVPRADLLEQVGLYDMLLGNDKDYLASRTAYHLDLDGPSVTVQTSCSTSLVAVHLAMQALLGHECDLALAGGVSVSFPQRRGYLHRAGDIFSVDGRCRPFDAEASGTVRADGVGLVVLKRLAEAIADGDTVHAVLKGSAVTNDGSARAGFTAPGVAGQVAAIRAAQQVAGVPPETIGYVEAHGTATATGDPIELTALTRAFAAATRPGTCALGSLKALVGHMDAAAGVGGLIKAVLAVRHGVLPPSPYFVRPNPAAELAGSPFYVNAEPLPWPGAGHPRRAGVSSFGLGGTNAHVVVEQAPEPAPSGPSRPEQVLVLSARTAEALAAARAELAAHLRARTETDLADAAHTLQVGRRALPHRLALVCRDTSEAVDLLTDGGAGWVGCEETTERSVVLMFPGQGAQYPGMGGELYRAEPAFRSAVDKCADLLAVRHDLDIRRVLYPGGQDDPELLDRTVYTQPGLFVVEYALARLWMSWGVRPYALVGHSIGEYVAACLAGVLSLVDALDVVVARGRLLEATPPGRMLAINLAAGDVEARLEPDLGIAASNAPHWCTVSGPAEAVARLRDRLGAEGVTCRQLRTARAFHSPMVEPALAGFAEALRRVTLRPPQVPVVSNVTGGWLGADEATSVDYWVRQLRQRVRFTEGIELLLQRDRQLLLEVGPGDTLRTLCAGHDLAAGGHLVLTSLPHRRDRTPETTFTHTTLGRLWLAGAALNWSGYREGERRGRIPLPTYPYARERHFVTEMEQPAATRVGQTGQLAAAVPAAHPAVLAADRSAGTAGQPALDADVRQVIRAIWQEALGIPEIDLHDDFFALGGHSLLATRVVAQIRDLFRVDLGPDAVFDAPTVARLSIVVEKLTDRVEPLVPELAAELDGLTAEQIRAELAGEWVKE
ncbi:beta-ketoacyl synthase N-terminal-like domain-containing protein [Polymorphospora sp. NPDC050346]|uniref:type I polyketide synthase n=1 Tax=Polymorphospora sp. NPDC050346 TaxID=3155780 RepID=UPI0033DEDCEE